MKSSLGFVAILIIATLSLALDSSDMPRPDMNEYRLLPDGITYTNRMAGNSPTCIADRPSLLFNPYAKFYTYQCKDPHNNLVETCWVNHGVGLDKQKHRGVQKWYETCGCREVNGGHGRNWQPVQVLFYGCVTSCMAMQCVWYDTSTKG